MEHWEQFFCHYLLVSLIPGPTVPGTYRTCSKPRSPRKQKHPTPVVGWANVLRGAGSSNFRQTGTTILSRT